MMQALHGTFSRAPVDPQLATAPTWTTQPAPASWLEVVGQDRLHLPCTGPAPTANGFGNAVGLIR